MILALFGSKFSLTIMVPGLALRVTAWPRTWPGCHCVSAVWAFEALWGPELGVAQFSGILETHQLLKKMGTLDSQARLLWILSLWWGRWMVPTDQLSMSAVCERLPRAPTIGKVIRDCDLAVATPRKGVSRILFSPLIDIIAASNLWISSIPFFAIWSGGRQGWLGEGNAKDVDPGASSGWVLFEFFRNERQTAHECPKLQRKPAEWSESTKRGSLPWGLCGPWR